MLIRPHFDLWGAGVVDTVTMAHAERFVLVEHNSTCAVCLNISNRSVCVKTCLFFPRHHGPSHRHTANGLNLHYAVRGRLQNPPSLFGCLTSQFQAIRSSLTYCVVCNAQLSRKARTSKVCERLYVDLYEVHLDEKT